MKTLAVHDGIFHSDDVFAVAILRLRYPDIQIRRTREPELLERVNIRVDVGRKYNPNTNDYDHHQGLKKKRVNGMPYAAAGLIWKHFGQKLVPIQEEFDYIDRKIIQPIDSSDTGNIPYETATINSNRISPITIDRMVHSFYPAPPDSKYDIPFFRAVHFTSAYLEREFLFAKSVAKARALIELKIRPDKQYIILDGSIPPPIWKEVLERQSKIDYVVSPYTSGGWIIETVPIDADRFDSRRKLPKAWSNLTDTKLGEAAGIEDAMFCHRDRFMMRVGSKESAIKVVEDILRKK